MKKITIYKGGYNARENVPYFDAFINESYTRS